MREDRPPMRKDRGRLARSYRERVVIREERGRLARKGFAQKISITLFSVQEKDAGEPPAVLPPNVGGRIKERR